MLIGVDFDNTIVRYDALFHQVAREQNVIPADLPRTKQAVRDYLRGIDQEDTWTEMQGYVYGERMIEDAEPFEGALAFFQGCQAAGISTCIISHKTKHPYRGKQYNLHAAAHAFLERHRFLEYADSIFFELTKAEKLARIEAQNCTHFIDDLPEFLTEANFPTDTQRILFDPHQAYTPTDKYVRMTTWAAIADWLLNGSDANGR